LVFVAPNVLALVDADPNVFELVDAGAEAAAPKEKTPEAVDPKPDEDVVVVVVVPPPNGLETCVVAGLLAENEKEGLGGSEAGLPNTELCVVVVGAGAVAFDPKLKGELDDGLLAAAASPNEKVDDLVTAEVVPNAGAAVVVAVDDDKPPNDPPVDDPKVGAGAVSLLPPPNENTPATPLALVFAGAAVAPPKLKAAVEAVVTAAVVVDEAVDDPNANTGAAAALVTAVLAGAPNEKEDDLVDVGAIEAEGADVVLLPTPKAKTGAVGFVSAAVDLEGEKEKEGAGAGLTAVASFVSPVLPKLKLGAGRVDEEVVSALVEVAVGVGTDRRLIAVLAASLLTVVSFAPKLNGVARVAAEVVVDIAVELVNAAVSVLVVAPARLKETDKPLLT